MRTAPYNFVPFAEKILLAEEIPHYSNIDSQRNTGDIHITLTAMTPVYVSNGEGTFVHDTAGHPMLPGSSVRGMVRGVAKILGFGCAKVGQDLDSVYDRQTRSALDITSALPQAHQKNTRTTDFVDGMFGFVDRRNILRSRLAFEDCALVGKARGTQTLKATLEIPHPEKSRNYCFDSKRITDPDCTLRGVKQYWLHEPPRSDEVGRNTLHPLPKGVRFSGIIHYRNLSDAELGLLLWSLQLNGLSYHSMGMGKALGLGRMDLRIDQLCQMNPRELYSLEGLSGALQEEKSAQDFIEEYLFFAEDKLEFNPKEATSVRELFFLRSTIAQERDVVDVAQDAQGDGSPLPTISQHQELWNQST